MRLSVVVPTLNEAERLPGLLAVLKADPAVFEVVVADGGSRDGTLRVASQAGARIATSIRGRGPQQNAGAAAATGDLLWFLHADSTLPTEQSLPAAILAAAEIGRWGCCAVRLDDPTLPLRLTAYGMNRRARHGGSCTGDMGIWMHRAFFEHLGGFPNLRAFEDLILSDRARAQEPATLPALPLTTSARRWQRHGTARTVARLWAFRVAYRVGVSPEWLAERW